MGTRSLLLIAVSIITGTAMMIGMSRQASENDQKVSAYQDEVLLNQIAKSAENLAVAQAKRDFDNAPTNVYQNNTKMKGGTFSSSATALGSDSLLVSITATFAGLQKEINTTLVRSAGAKTLDAAVMVDAPFSEIVLTGTQFCIIGYDYSPPSIGGSSPGLHVGGLQSTSRLVRDQVRTAMNGSRMGNIMGVNGSGDIYQGNFAMDINNIYRDAVMNAGQTHDGENISGTFGSAASPVILHVTGDADVQGSFDGYGILVIDGNLDTSNGNIFWEGLVIVNKESDMNIHFGHSSLIYGVMIVMNGSRAFNMPGNGTLDVTYYQSGSSMGSSLNIRPVGQSSAEVFATGANSGADQSQSWATTYEMGQQINFFTMTQPPSGSPYHRMARANTPAYMQQPHAKIRSLGPESWEIKFETGATGMSEEEAAENSVELANWDYYDEKIIVDFISDNTTPPGVNLPGWDSTFGFDTPMSSGPASMHMEFHGTGSVLYSSEAIDRISGMIPALNPAEQIVIATRRVEAEVKQVVAP